LGHNNSVACGISEIVQHRVIIGKCYGRFSPQQILLLLQESQYVLTTDTVFQRIGKLFITVSSSLPMDNENLFTSLNAVEYYVGSAKQWAYYHQQSMGFDLRAYAGPETGVRDRVSYLLQQGKVKLIFTSFLNYDSPVADHVRLHGDGVKDISMDVENIGDTLEFVKKRGVVKIKNQRQLKVDSGNIRTAELTTYGETVHTLVDYSEAGDDLPPGFEVVDRKGRNVGLKKIDHIVGNVEDRMMDQWVNFYIKGLGFNQLVSFDDKDISTEYSSLRSKVVQYGNRKIIFPINEPAVGLKKSQIQEYLDYYNSPGVQHIALETDNIIKTVSEMKSRGVEFLYTPSVYYNELADRIGKIDEKIETLEKLNILVDRDDDGYLLQIFTKPIGDRPTFFYEVIQRKGATSFGKGNFRELFRSIEAEQEKRGNL
jgi:4-hydroxyphenylpyruvate dioxygenase